MPWGKGKSIKLAEFSELQLEDLADAYPIIRANLALQGELSTVRLPDARGRDRRLEELRRREAAGELWIRVSYAGNLNVAALAAPEVGEPDTYIAILKRPARTA